MATVTENLTSLRSVGFPHGRLLAHRRLAGASYVDRPAKPPSGRFRVRSTLARGRAALLHRATL